MRTTAIVQARMASSRLPGKVLKPLAGKPMLGRLLDRLVHCTRLDAIVVATSTSVQDDAVAAYATEYGSEVFRGSEPDVLDRYYQAARKYDADPIVRITADCPLIDPQVVDLVVEAFFEQKVDHASNSFCETYPDGQDTDVYSFKALERCWHEAPNGPCREHIHAHMLKHPEAFSLYNVMNDEDLGNHCWSVDSPEDFGLVEAIFDLLGGDHIFSMADILDCINQHPERFPIIVGQPRNGWKKEVGL